MAQMACWLALCPNLFLTSFSVEVFQNIVCTKKRQTNKCHHFHGLYSLNQPVCEKSLSYCKKLFSFIGFAIIVYMLTAFQGLRDITIITLWESHTRIKNGCFTDRFQSFLGKF